MEWPVRFKTCALLLRQAQKIDYSTLSRCKAFRPLLLKVATMDVSLPRLDQVSAVKVPVKSLSPSDSPRRLGENLAHVRMLAQSEDLLPPIVVHRSTMRVVDGMHRLRAAELRGEDEIEVRFIDGDEASTFVLAVSENVRHGLPLSTADRKAAAARIIDSYPEWSDRMVASVTGLSAKTVATTRRQVNWGSRQRRPLYTVGRDGRIRPRDSAQRREFARRLMVENPDCSLRKVAQIAGISPETARDVRNRLNNGVGTADQAPARTGSAKAARPAAERSHGPAVAGATALRALRADPAFRSTESGRSLLRMLVALQVLEGQGDQLLGNIPVHCTSRVAQAARACASAWEEFAGRLDEQSRTLSGDRSALSRVAEIITEPRNRSCLSLPSSRRGGSCRAGPMR
jgi:ParB-like chromosome segregation protein Spo0J